MLYLKWSDYPAGSVKRIISNMFSYLSPRWYPKNILGTSMYKMLYMSADQLASASTEITATYNDQNLDLVRTIPVSSNNAKIYDNFGVLLQTSKQTSQNYETFNNNSGMQDYRTNLKLLNEASTNATTQLGTDLVGQSYTGAAPYVIDRQRLGYDGWGLFVHTGSVVAVGNGFIVSDTYIPRIGMIIPTPTGTTGKILTINNTLPAGMGDLNYLVGDKAYITTGNGNAVIRIDAMTGGGTVASASLVSGGTGGYKVGTGNTTKKITGRGNNKLVIEIKTIDAFVVGDKFKISYTKLGTNTKIYSKKQVYNGLDIEVFSPNPTGEILTLNTTLPTGGPDAYYSPGDLFKIITGNGDATGSVVAMTPGGTVKTVALVSGGTGGYSIGTNNATQVITGIGNGSLIVEITSIIDPNTAETYTHNASDPSFKASIEKNITRNIRADISPRFFYNTSFTLNTASGSAGYNPNYFGLNNTHVDNITDTTPLIDGHLNEISGSVIGTTSSIFHTSNVLMDWTCVAKNGAYYDRYLRSYASASIPSTVYYQKVSTKPVDWMSDTANCGAHWIMLSSSSIYDASNHSNTLNKYSTSSYPALELGRSPERTAYSMNLTNHGTGSTLLFTGNTTKDIDAYYGLTAEFWIKGIDKYFAKGTGFIVLKREATSLTNTALSSDGYMITIKASGSTQTFSYSAKLTSTTTTASASIASYLLEEPSRYHYFAVTHKNNNVKFFVDGALISSGSVAIHPQNLSPAPTTFYMNNTNNYAYNVVVDEIMVSSGAITPDDIKSRFYSYAPRYNDPVVIPYYLMDNYYQSKISVFASGSGDFQYYDFAIKAVDPRYFRKKDKSFYNLYTLPLMKI